MTPAEARSQAAAEWDALNLDGYSEADFIRDYPTLDESGYPVEVDEYAAEATEYLLGFDPEREAWLINRTDELLRNDAPALSEDERRLSEAEAELQAAEEMYTHYLDPAARFEAQQSYVRKTA